METEFSAALSLKLRTGQLEPLKRAELLRVFAETIAESLVVLPIARTHFRTAARFSDNETLGLRAGDALHLAICAESGATLCTLDKRQADAGTALGIRTALL